MSQDRTGTASLPESMNPPFPARPEVDALGAVHFIGMGGTGMSAVAELLLGHGVPVSGSDAKDNAALEVLRQKGATVCVPQDPANLAGAQTVVVSTAIKESNPELSAARAAGLRILHRSDALAAAMGRMKTIAVAGTHGKTTTSGMISVMLDGLGLRPSFAVGATVSPLGTNAALGDTSGAGWFVAEADESDGSFVKYAPHLAVVTNVEPDHLDFYGTSENVTEAFRRFGQTLVPGGTMVACWDDPGSRALAQAHRDGGGQVLTYGLQDGADLRLGELSGEGTASTAEVRYRGTVAGQERSGHLVLNLSVPGQHNQLNAAAALACALVIGADMEAAARALTAFGGTGRRFEKRGEASGVVVFDDYAHHPTEVAAALRAGRTVAGRHRVLALFQPHLFSRTQAFATEFAQALGLADRAWVVDIFPAREEPVEGVTSRLVTDAAAESVQYAASVQQAVQAVAELAEPGDIVMTVGAGDVTTYGPLVLAALAQEQA